MCLQTAHALLLAKEDACALAAVEIRSQATERHYGTERTTDNTNPKHKRGQLLAWPSLSSDKNRATDEEQLHPPFKDMDHGVVDQKFQSLLGRSRFPFRRLRSSVQRSDMPDCSGRHSIAQPKGTIHASFWPPFRFPYPSPPKKQKHAFSPCFSRFSRSDAHAVGESNITIRYRK